jgi:peptidase E
MLGPQRAVPTLTEVLDRLGVGRRVTLITAGWQEREDEDDDLKAACGGRACVNLNLYQRWEQILRSDPAFARAHRARQDHLRKLQELYRMRLDHGMEAAHQLQQVTDAPAHLLASELEHALEAVRDLDRHHLDAIASTHASFEAEMPSERRPSVARHLAELNQLLNQSDALLIAGGHVAVLLNRLRCFLLDKLLADHPRLPVVSWSAGAMAASASVVLFHDTPPQGFGYPEVFDVGLDLFPGVLPLPHARSRLVLQDTQRVSLFARRFQPLESVTLDDRSVLLFSSRGDRLAEGVSTLKATGEVAPLPARPLNDPT